MDDRHELSENKNEGRNFGRIAILTILTLLVVLGLIYFFTLNTACNAEEAFSEKEIYGVVLEKDSTKKTNHPLITFKDQDEHTHRIDLEFEKDGLYEYAEPGDSISKESGTMDVTIYKTSESKSFTISFGCEK